MINADIQKLEPGSLVSLFELDAVALGGDIERFHPHNQLESIIWQGKEYFPWAMETEGFGKSGERPVNPILRVGNVDGSISALCIFFDDLVGAKVIRRRTLGRFLDPENFPEGNPEANPNEEFPPETWYIERKVSETVEMVEFELASALNFEGVMLPRRQIIANQCPFRYRGPECGYAGGPVATTTDEPTSSLSSDRCGKRLASCRMRFGQNASLPFGGFPAAALMRS